MKKEVFNQKVEFIFLCIRMRRFRTPIGVVQGYLGGAKRTLKPAKRLKASKRAVKDVKRDIKVAKRILSELEYSDDLRAIENKLLRRHTQC